MSFVPQIIRYNSVPRGSLQYIVLILVLGPSHEGIDADECKHRTIDSISPVWMGTSEI